MPIRIGVAAEEAELREPAVRNGFARLAAEPGVEVRRLDEDRGSPFDILVGARVFRRTAEDVAALRQAACRGVFLGAAELCPEADAWRTFRRTGEAKRVALVVPRVRLDGVPVNPAFLLAGVIARAAVRNGWYAEICGSEGGRVEGRVETDLALDEKQERLLAEQGITTLLPNAGGEGATFWSVPSLFDSEEPMERALARLNYTLPALRLAHFLRWLRGA